MADIKQLKEGDILSIDDLAVVPKKTKYWKEGYLQPPKDLQYRYEDVQLESDSDETANNDVVVNGFGFGKRKVIETPRFDVEI